MTHSNRLDILDRYGEKNETKVQLLFLHFEQNWQPWRTQCHA